MIYDKSDQILGYAYDLDLDGRTDRKKCRVKLTIHNKNFYWLERERGKEKVLPDIDEEK